MSKKIPVLAIIVPCFNEEAVLPYTVNELTISLQGLLTKGKIAEGSYLCLVDDGSTDNTWKLIQEAAQQNPNIKGIKLSSNFGHQNALVAYKGFTFLFLPK